MSDALGGLVNIIIIVVFIVLVSGYLAFNVNYTKAFRMKNKIIAVYDDYNGICTSNCHKAIKEYANEIGYKPQTINCPSTPAYKKDTDSIGYCIAKISQSPSNGVIKETNGTYYYKVLTKINIEIPILNHFLDIKPFQIVGNTKTYKNE